MMSILGNAIMVGGGSPTPPTPPTPSTEKAVTFTDYDGTVLYEYTADEFQALSALPANPTHAGLTSQGWNWTLADAKAQVTSIGSCVIGQMYITDDGKTRIYIHLEERRLSPYCRFGVNGTAVIDWGDGSSTNTVTGSSLSTLESTQHVYSTAGDYVITLTVSSGSIQLFGKSNTGSYLLGADTSTGNKTTAKVYQNAIQKIEIGSNCDIGTYAFQYCYSLSSITMPNSVTSIGTYAFSDCYALSSVTIPNSVASISNYAFYNCCSLSSVTIPNSVTSIGTAFYNCRSLSSITIPGSVTSIGSYAFSGCYSLSSIIIPNNVASIGNYAFQSCYSLSSVTMSNSVTSISLYAFSGCQSLSSITIPNSVRKIDSYAFSGCSSLSSIIIPNSVTKIETYAFSSCTSLLSVTMSNSVTGIGAYAFSGCTALSSVTISNSVTSISNYTFSGCYSLSSITIPGSVIIISASAFANCRSLPSITIPHSVTSISTSAFNNCYGFSFIKFEPTTPPTVASSNAWTNIPTDCIIYVPSGTLSAYTSATNYPSSSTYTYVEY